MIVFDADQVLHVLPFLSITAGVMVLFVGKLLNERGLLRGADYVLMCEIVRVHEALDRARPANFVVEALQLLPAPPPAVDDGGDAEPRLVPIAAGWRGQA